MGRRHIQGEFSMRQQLQYIVTRIGMQTPGGIGLYSFDESSSHKKRDDYIRSFEAKGPAVFVVTLNTRWAGIKLPAASHVFLM